MYESIYKNNELENEVSSDMSYFWYSDIDQLSRGFFCHQISLVKCQQSVEECC